MSSKAKKQEKADEKLNKLGYNPGLVSKIQTAGGISFKDEKYVKIGDGYEAVIHIYEYPKHLDIHWLATVMNINNVVADLDVSTEDTNEVKKYINRSMKEQDMRYMQTKEATEKRDAEQRYQELDTMYQELTALGEIVKLLHLRLFVSARTVEELDKQVKGVVNYLESNGYKSAIFLNETKNEWLAMYATYTEQNANAYKRYGQPMLTEALAGGNPFHFTSLSDENGTYLGTTTSSNGSVLFDMFTQTKNRMSYNGLVIGQMGAGKSTTLKKLLYDMAIRGHFVRGFDVTGEYTELVNYLGGKIISLDGTDGILNSFEILKTDEQESICYTRHIAKLDTIYKFLVPNADTYEIVEFEQLVRKFYVEYGLISKDIPLEKQQLTGKLPTEYPIWSDFLSFIERYIADSKETKDNIKNQLDIIQLKRINNVKLVVENIVKTYGGLLDGHTSIENILDTQIVFFNIKNLANMKPEIFDAQMFAALSLCWDNCVKIGSRMKYLYDTKQIEWADIVRFMIFGDEAHRFVNTHKLAAVEQIVTYCREARKYFGGILLASQSIRDFVPEGSDDKSIDQIKTLFELSQYKFIMRQDSNLLGLLNSVFQYQLTEAELNDVPRLQKGQCIMAIGGEGNIKFNIEITQQENELFQGGA